MLPEDMPVGLEPVYRMATVNQPIILYQGAIELRREPRRQQVRGSCGASGFQCMTCASPWVWSQ